jgi:hypothetical protein
VCVCVFDTHERGIVVGHWHRRRIDPTNSFSGACQVSLPAMERPVIISLVPHENSLESNMRTPSGVAQASQAHVRGPQLA